jgi:N-acetylneuraminate lyase
VKRYTGMMVAPLTPMNSDGEVMYGAVEPLAQLLIDRGAQGFYLCGGTGEGMLLTVPERMRLAETWCRMLAGHLPVFVHIGHVCPEDAKALARHAAKVGAASISSVTPPVYPAADVGMLVRYFASIAREAPELPFYYYHSSGSAGLKVKGVDYLAAAEREIPNMAGMKFTHEDLMDLSRCIRFAGGRYDIFYGKDEMMLGALATGARGFIGGSYNYTAPLARQTLESHRAGDLEQAQQSQGQLVDLIAVFGRFGGLPAVKASMHRLGIDCGPCRLPLRNLDGQQRQSLQQELDRLWPEALDATQPLSDLRPSTPQTRRATVANG